MCGSAESCRVQGARKLVTLSPRLARGMCEHCPQCSLFALSSTMSLLISDRKCIWPVLSLQASARLHFQFDESSRTRSVLTHASHALQARSRRAAPTAAQDGHSRPRVLWVDSPRCHPSDRITGPGAPLLQVLEWQAGQCPTPVVLLEVQIDVSYRVSNSTGVA